MTDPILPLDFLWGFELRAHLIVQQVNLDTRIEDIVNLFDGRNLMTITHVRCSCGVVEMQLKGAPMAQYICHCDDCQAVHGKGYAVALYPASAVEVTRGETDSFSLKTSPRTKCSRCATYLFAEVPGYPFRGVNADLLPDGRFNPEFHVQCRFAVAPIEDELPHYKDRPAKFRGSGELMSW